MLGTIVNAGAILGGCIIALVGKKCIKRVSGEKIKGDYESIILQALSLCVFLIGIKNAMSIKGDDFLLVIFSMVIGSMLGEWINIEGKLEGLGDTIENKFDMGESKVSKAFVTTSLIYCIGAMAILGALEDGLKNNHEILYAKSVLDGISSIIFTSTMGIGVAFSALSVLIYQGSISLGATYLKGVLTENLIGQITPIGGLLIIALSFNMLKVTKIKVGNMLPALLVPVVYSVIILIF
ncbi:DUF554 domain-containing protein [Anaeromicrobium sediminis]|uniref:DUF554 domain-containing protein n=1 Tax=Anaeromicrobium sediminis TaxID=1478221 RepID=A0A267MIB8_9FIRM|nr:DUF554 domain-containing protein [Anaeromicrobium sediminis]PAB59324.1 hypothetical protein CCE28_10700 [Anaeromicrobium sediminis]